MGIVFFYKNYWCAVFKTNLHSPSVYDNNELGIVPEMELSTTYYRWILLFDSREAVYLLSLSEV